MVPASFTKTRWLMGRKRPAPAPVDPFPEPVGSAAAIVTFWELPCLTLYFYTALTLSLFLLWAVRRSCSKYVLRGVPSRGARQPRQKDFGGDLHKPFRQEEGSGKPSQHVQSSQVMTDLQGRSLIFKGYVNSKLGTLVWLFVPLTSLVLVLLYAIIVYDYYAGCEWKWPDQLCYIGKFPLFGSYEVNSHVFLILWCVGILWFAILIWGSGGRMGNAFRLPSPLLQAKYVHVAVQEQRDSIHSGYSRILRARERLGRFLVRVLGLRDLPGGLFSLSGKTGNTVLLQTDHQLGLRFIEFRCVRYMLDPSTGLFAHYDPGSALHGGHETFLEVFKEGGLHAKAQAFATGGELPAAEQMFRAAGPNHIPFEVDTWGAALTEEFATFFFLYQFANYAVCLWFSYWHYTVLALVVAFSSGVFNALVRLSSQRSIKGMMAQSSKVQVLRDGVVQTLDSKDIVPGDIVKVEDNGWPVPCDLLLLQGAAVCDESTLTGESMPVQRLAPTELLPNLEPSQRFPQKHCLVAGTTVLQSSGGDSWAVATHTGVNTQKGQLLLLILHPPKLLFKYDEQLPVVVAFLIIYAGFVMVFSMTAMYTRFQQEHKLPFTATWAAAIFTISCVLPTMLHIVLSVGQVVSAKRLKGEDCNVYCVAPKRIGLGGKVRVACFDKTGTLTTNTLEFFGVHCVCPGSVAATSAAAPFDGLVERFTSTASHSSLEPEPRGTDWPLEVHCGLASAHSLSPFSSSEAGVIGNAVEVNMFKGSKWQLVSPSQVRSPPELGVHGLHILRRFDFSHSTMTMSAVVEHVQSGQRGIYCKGSFEQVSRLCRPETIPANFFKVAEAHAYSGMYVLALAGRALTSNSAGLEQINTREEAEHDLVMLGLLLFKNPLRSDTRQTIERLRAGEVRPVMITGDTAGTAIRIAKESALVHPGVPVLLADLAQEPGSKVSTVQWRCLEEDLTTLNGVLLGNEWLTWRRNYKQWREGGGHGARGEPAKRSHGSGEESQMLRSSSWPTTEEADAGWSFAGTGAATGSCSGTLGPRQVSKPPEEQEFIFSTEELVLSRLFEWCELAVTQRAYEWLQATTCSADLRRVLLSSRLASLKKGRVSSKSGGVSSLAWELMTSIRIFARMTPSGKVSVVEGLMNQDLICAMVGDGGNDSGALRTAHVGLALSNATSATVVAPFTTNRGSIAPIEDLLREGRAALTTSFAGYKYCVHYGLLNSFFKMLTYWHGVRFCMSCHYLQDIVGFLSMSWAMSLGRPAKVLAGDRPTSSLFSVYTIASVLSMWIINMIFLWLCCHVVFSHPDFAPFPGHRVRMTQWWKLSRNWEMTTFFFVVLYQQFWSSVVFSFGNIFRLPWYHNLVLLFLVIATFALLTFLLLSQPNALTRFFHLVYEEITDYEPWTKENPCPPMPLMLRAKLFALIVTDLTLVALSEKVLIQGAVGHRLREMGRRLSKHVTLRL